MNRGMKKWPGLIFLLFWMAPNGYSQHLGFNEDIAPIIYRHCAPCHRPSGAAPFPLTSYPQVHKHARMALAMVEAGLMPPWKADTSYRNFAHHRGLSPSEKEKLRQWIDQGALEGDGPVMDYQVFLPASQLAKPDRVLTLDTPIAVSGQNRDVFAWIKYPFELPAETTVTGLAFIPGDVRRVHHANLMVYAAPDNADLHRGNTYWRDGVDTIDPEWALGLTLPDGSDPPLVFVDGWVPGVTPRPYPAETGFRMPRRGWIVLQTIHYGPSPHPSLDSSRIELWFGEAKKTLELGIMGSTSRFPVEPPLVIKANEQATFHASMPIQDTLIIYQVLGHMHLLGKSFKAWATTPTGETIPLLHIPEWDFNWQEFYEFKTPQRLLPGSTLWIEGIFDNTDTNPNNPHHPPIDVYSKGNMETRDEMLQLIFRFTRTPSQ